MTAEPLPPGACLRLRTKAMYTPVSSPPPDPQRSWRTAVFWCQKTMRALGPDGEPAEPRACGPERRCFEGTAARPPSP